MLPRTGRDGLRHEFFVEAWHECAGDRSIPSPQTEKLMSDVRRAETPNS
jgi:hypothetical protein